MTATTESIRHYASLLAPRYTWMMGGLDNCLANARALLDAVNIGRPQGTKAALDLGSGPGYHSRALAERGYAVTAVDTSRECLDELKVTCSALAVTPIEGDLSDFGAFAAHGPFAVILCVGDTLTHLGGAQAVDALIERAAGSLVPGGVLVLEFREQLHLPDAGDAVFTMRAERDRIMQCVLHFEREKVWVTDIVHEWTGTAWRIIKSSYPKLRVSGEQILAQARRCGLHAVMDQLRKGQRLLALRQTVAT